MITVEQIVHITRILEHIEANLGHHGTYMEIAQMVPVSTTKLWCLFKEITGESYDNYIIRVKMELAYRILHAEPSLLIQLIAVLLGYGYSGSFSTAFNKAFGILPSHARFLKQKPVTRHINPDFESDIRFGGICEMADRFVVYRRVFKGYTPEKIRSNFCSLSTCVMQDNLEVCQSIGVIHDDPDYTPHNKCRYDVCFSINTAFTKPRRLYNSKWIKGGTYACYHFSGKEEELHAAWNYITRNWQDGNEYMIDITPRLEIFSKHFNNNRDRFHATLYLPVKKKKRLKS
ncbi:AraC family transcriptional regulator [Microbacter margulisiae]|uniref:AraC family transcriptional regulator n=1 Tax=Microbacter margulisiae TaxID=1350067 RepID=A0A7W5DSJ7_9PORP|nr:GyrI-like domain-containing protein [Microbacter margulisiae]MBB3188292.1 AraC family transcriptional regulator [Microbacter margulisiae]